MAPKSIESAYLDRLEFDPALNNSIFTFFLDRMRFLFLIIVIIAIAGFLSLRSLPLESNPEVKIGIANVVTTLPGASPEVMEDLVTKKIEKEVAKIKGIDTLTSVSQNSVSAITVQFRSDADISTTLREVKDKVDLAKSKLPTDAEDPVVQEFSFDNQPVWIFSIAGPYNGFQLYAFAKKIQEELERNALVSEANISGGDETEFHIEADPRKLESYGLTLTDLNNTLKANNLAFPIGDIEVGSYKHVLNVDQRFYSVRQIADLPLAKLGTTGVVYIKDVATVLEAPKKRTSLSRLSVAGSEPQSAVTISVVKKRGGSIVNLVSEGEASLKTLQDTGTLPKDLKITTIQDNAERIKLDLEHLIRDGLITILLVFVTLFLVIGIKEALVAGTSAPLVFLVTFAVMAVAGQTLNFLSMFALILSLGLLVDDAIVVISAINQYKRTGKFTTREAALLVLRDYKKVLVSTTLTVVWIFSAMLFMTGIIGKFIFSIPFIITTTLLASLVIALTINPGLAIVFDHLGERAAKIGRRKSRLSELFDHGIVPFHKIENWYAGIVSGLLVSRRRAFMFLGGTILLFIVALMLPVTGLLKSEFFPKTDQDLFAINLEAEAGTTLTQTAKLIQEVEARLRKEKEVKSFATTVGSASSLGDNGGATTGSNYANITVNLIKKEYGRKELSPDIASRLRKEFVNIRDAKVTVAELQGGPPAGADFEIKIAGENFTTLERIAQDIKGVLTTIPGTINIQSSRKALPAEFRLTFDPVKLALYDVTLPQAAAFVKNSVDATEATKVYKGTDEIVVRTTYGNSSVDTLDKIRDLKMKNNKWQDVYLRDIMKNSLSPSVFAINRSDQKRVITVSAAADGTTGAEILKQFNTKTANYTLPKGYEFILGGANDENAKSVQSLLVAMLFGLLFIVGTLVVLFDSYRQAVLALVTIPLSLIGVFFGLTLFMQPLSFPGLIGLVALFGIVVRNGIILFDKINLNIAENIPFVEAIVDAGKTRLEPVVLTSVCTVLGMIPLTLSNPTWTSLGLSIIFGLTASTMFTLLVLPTLFFLFLRSKAKKI